MNNLTPLINCSKTNDFGVSYYYYYIHPVVALFASIQGILTTFILAQKELRTKGAFYQYSLFNSIQNGLCVFLFSFIFLSRCGNLCTTSTLFWAQAYERYSVFYIAQSLYISASIIQIATSLQLYFTVSQKFKRLAAISPVKVMIIVEIVCFVLCLSIVYVDDVLVYNCLDPTTLQIKTVYYRQITNNIPFVTLIAQFLLIVSNYIVLVILLVVNALVYVELRKIMARKRAIISRKSLVTSFAVRTSRVISIGSVGNNLESVKSEINNESESQRKTLIMVLWISFAFGLSRLAYAINTVFAFGSFNSVANLYGGVFNFFWISVVYISQSYIYYRTNNIFKKKFCQIVFRQNNERSSIGPIKSNNTSNVNRVSILKN